VNLENGIGLWEWDLESDLFYLSPCWKEMLGYTDDEIENLFSGWQKLWHPEDAPKIDQNIQEQIEGKKDYLKIEYRMLDKDGNWRWILTRADSIKTPQGKLIRLLGTNIDLTRIKNVEEETVQNQQQKQAEEKLLYLSCHDSLTNLYHRSYFKELLQNSKLKQKFPLKVIMADLNGLKLINDSYGCDLGDKMLKTAASILKQCCREDDIIARWGGDEFVILMPQASWQEADYLCKKISHSCSHYFIEGVPISLTLGVAAANAAKRDLMPTLREAEDQLARQKLTENRSAKNAVLQTLLKTLAAKSFETEAHTRRMQVAAQKIGRKLNLADSEFSRLDLLITLHDIGKINIAEEILTKKGPLEQKEWEIIKTHPEVGFRIAHANYELCHVAEEILAHHERWDGKGYPQGLRRDEIPLSARITAIVDAYDVMKNGRPYKQPMSKEEIVAEFKKCSGTQFDPELVNTFLPILE